MDCILDNVSIKICGCDNVRILRKYLVSFSLPKRNVCVSVNTCVSHTYRQIKLMWQNINKC